MGKYYVRLKFKAGDDVIMLEQRISWAGWHYRKGICKLVGLLMTVGSVLPFIASCYFFGLYVVSERLLQLLGVSSLDLQIVLAVPLFFVPVAALAFYYFSFRCPQCRNLFFLKSAGWPPEFGDGVRCPHCSITRDTH